MEETPLEEGKAVASPTSLKEEDAPLDEENAPEAAVAAASEEPFNGQEPPGSPEESSDQVPLTRDVGLETEMPSPSAEEQGKEGGSGEADVGGQEKDADAFEEGGEGDEEEDNAVAEEDDNAVAEEEVQERLEGKTGLDQGALFSETKSETDAQNAAHSPHSAQGLSDRSPSSRGSSQVFPSPCKTTVFVGGAAASGLLRKKPFCAFTDSSRANPWRGVCAAKRRV